MLLLAHGRLAAFLLPLLLLFLQLLAKLGLRFATLLNQLQRWHGHQRAGDEEKPNQTNTPPQKKNLHLLCFGQLLVGLFLRQCQRLAAALVVLSVGKEGTRSASLDTLCDGGPRSLCRLKCNALDFLFLQGLLKSLARRQLVGPELALHFAARRKRKMSTEV